MVSKFQDNPTVNKSGIVVLLGQVWVYAGKKRVLGEKEERMNLRGRKSVKTYRNGKHLHNISLFMAKYFVPIIYSIFYFFIIL